MRVAFVSTYPPAECGIGNYARELRRALANAEPDVDVTILAERAPKRPDSDTAVTRCWDRRGNWVDDLVRAIRHAHVDAIHVQHEESHYGQDHRFITLLERVRALGIRTIVTLHSVYDRVLDLPLRVPGRSFHRRLEHACDAIIVHQHAGMADVLLAHGVPHDSISVIPHGTPVIDLPSRDLARAALGIPRDAPIALFFGFIHHGKNVHTAVRAFENAAIPNAHLLIAGRMRNAHIIDRIYSRLLTRQMRRGIAEGRILYRPGFASPETKLLYFAAADLLLLPHRQAYGSASGVMHEALGARRAIMFSRGKKFANAVELFAPDMPFIAPAAGDTRAWAAGIHRLLTSATDRSRVIAHADAFTQLTSWTASARRHAELYRSVLGVRAAQKAG